MPPDYGDENGPDAARGPSGGPPAGPEDADGPAQPPVERPRMLLPIALFLVTALTTTVSGALQVGADIFADPASLALGLPFSASLILILGSHELGHFIASRRHRVAATLPTFIPGPPIPPMIGTFGAVIRMKSQIRSKGALVDIGAAGPLTGFVVALAVSIVGLAMSTAVKQAAVEGGLGLGDSIIFKLLSWAVIGPLPEGYDVMLHPVAFAGWIGFFVTAMNLLPIGQLDGGHIVYALIGTRHRYFSYLMIAALVVFGAFTWHGWLIWALLITVLGVWHPPVADQDAPMDPKRRLISGAALAVFVLTFMPTPFYII